MHKTNCMQNIENISTWEVFSSNVLKGLSRFYPTSVTQRKKKVKDRKILEQL